VKLATVCVQNFKCIEDSTPFRVDGLTCLVGKNEAGKSALLQALDKLNPVVKEYAAFVDLEYPRRRWSEYKDRRERRPDNVLTTQWLLDDGDLAALAEVLGPGAVTYPEVTIKRGYDNVTQYVVPIDEKKVVEYLLRSTELYQEEQQALEGANHGAGTDLGPSGHGATLRAAGEAVGADHKDLPGWQGHPDCHQHTPPAPSEVRLLRPLLPAAGSGGAGRPRPAASAERVDTGGPGLLRPAFVTARRSFQAETLNLGSLRGRHFVESAKFGDYVLSIVHEPNLPREDGHAR